MARPYHAKPGPWLVAHRGGSLLAPENTHLAFDRALELGADAIETDVHLTRDGVVVVFHDDETSRLTGAPGTVEERTLAEVLALDPAFGFTTDGGPSTLRQAQGSGRTVTFPLRGMGVKVPTLLETFVRYPAMRFNIDAKNADPALAGAIVRTVKQAGAVERTCLGSFFDVQAERLRALLPEAASYLPEQAATCHVMAALSGQSADGCPSGYDQASLPYRMRELTVVTQPVVEHFHRLGMPVHVWTVDDEEDMRALLVLGVDGIVTDRPDLLARVLGRGR